MKIAIDISSVVYGTGVSVYARNLVRALLKINGRNEYVLFAGTWRQNERILEFEKELRKGKGIKEGENFEVKILPIPPKLQAVLWNDWHVLSLEKLIGSHDVYHSLDWSMAPTKAKTLITVHDLFFLKRPDLQQHPYRKTLETRLKRARDKKIYAIAVSEATKKDLVELLGYPEELVTVVYEAADLRVKSQESRVKNDEILKKYGLEKPYLLMVGTLEPRKNLRRTIKAFGKLESRVKSQESRELKLVIAGKGGWGTSTGSIDSLQAGSAQVFEKQNFGESVKFIGYVSDEDKFALMKSAVGFLYPSLYEGFGLPILEAFACGVPVLTSNVSSMPEVAGRAPSGARQAAIYVDPYDMASIRAGVEKMINLSNVERNKLIQNGYKQLKKFSWEKAARETLKIYKAL
jgi:glycosyltransferase involved in cell wall biosynthesis